MEFDISIRLFAFLSVFALMASWETIAPRRQQSTLRLKRWIANLSVAVLNIVVIRIVLASGAVGIAMVAADQGWGIFNMLDWPVWLEVMLALLLFDLLIYLQHVTFHNVPILWKVHMVHHADPDYDVTTAVRFHPVEAVLSMVLKIAGVAMLGASPTAVLAFEVILNGMAMFNHANVRIVPSVDGILRWMLVTPDMHRTHHSIVPRETNSNFGFNLPWWDHMFGTYRENPSLEHERMILGVRQFRSPAYLKLSKILKLPFQLAARHEKEVRQMKSMMNFTKTMLIMPIHWQVWLGALVTVNIIMPLFFIETMEAQIVLASGVGGLVIMSAIFNEKGFVRLMGIGHIGWIPLVFLLWLSLDFAPAESAFGYWLMTVIVLDSLSVLIDTIDVLRYVNGEREPFLALSTGC